MMFNMSLRVNNFSQIIVMSEIIQRRTGLIRQQQLVSSCPKYDFSKDRKCIQTKILEPIHHQPSYMFRKHNQIEAQFNQTSLGSFRSSRSSSYQLSSKCKHNFSSNNAQIQQQNFSLSRYGFPQRKKKSGEQQLLKLLLRCADKLAQNQKYQKELRMLHGPLFDQNVQTHQKIIPRLKYRTRFNWSKANESSSTQQSPRFSGRPIINGFPLSSTRQS